MVLLFFLSSLSLFAFGQKDVDDREPINNEWRLCITSFDYSLLPQARHIAGDVITRSLVDKLKTVDYRLRLSPEYAYYEGYAWQQAVTAAAKAVSQKRDERSQMLFRGEPDWRYRRNLQKVDEEIEKLTAALAEKEAQKPLVNTEPVFALSQTNTNGTFPAPPAPGTERRFCRGQNSDAFLTGQLREFHGRYYIRLRLYILYVNSFVYEDDIIFSMEDSGGAVDEISARLTAVLSGNKPALLAIQASPPESQILVNQSYAGRGAVETRERPPGTVIIAVGAEGYSPVTMETKINSGELTEVAVNLSPLHFADVNISTPGKTGVMVYNGALYVGEAPLTLRLPIDRLEYINVETAGGETGRAVFAVPEMPNDTLNLSLKTKMPPAGERRVNKARSWYYWALGGTWTAGIIAWITTGIFDSQNNALPNSSSADFYENTLQMYNISTGALVVLGAAVAYEIFQMYRYISIASEGATPIARRERQ